MVSRLSSDLVQVIQRAMGTWQRFRLSAGRIRIGGWRIFGTGVWSLAVSSSGRLAWRGLGGRCDWCNCGASDPFAALSCCISSIRGSCPQVHPHCVAGCILHPAAAVPVLPSASAHPSTTTSHVPARLQPLDLLISPTPTPTPIPFLLNSPGG